MPTFVTVLKSQWMNSTMARILFLPTLLACSVFCSSAFTTPSRPMTFSQMNSKSLSRTFMTMTEKDRTKEEKTEDENSMAPTMGVFVPPGKESSVSDYGVPQGDFPVAEKEKEEKEMSETQKLMQKVKDSGLAGIISYALWELGFWTLSIPVCIIGYQELTGHWPDLKNGDDLQKLGAEAFAFVNFARFAVPLRIGLALSTTPWIQKNIVDRFNINKKVNDAEQ